MRTMTLLSGPGMRRRRPQPPRHVDWPRVHRRTAIQRTDVGAASRSCPAQRVDYARVMFVALRHIDFERDAIFTETGYGAVSHAGRAHSASTPAPSSPCGTASRRWSFCSPTS
jgi:hypothetical protein